MSKPPHRSREVVDEDAAKKPKEKAAKKQKAPSIKDTMQKIFRDTSLKKVVSPSVGTKQDKDVRPAPQGRVAAPKQASVQQPVIEAHEKKESLRNSVMQQIEEPFELLEKKLREFSFYHGFLPREDLQYVLKSAGEYLLRIDEGPGKVRREVILSLVPTAIKDNPNATQNSAKSVRFDQAPVAYRNVIVKRRGQHFYIEKTRPFDTPKDLLEFYKTNNGTVNSISFMLKTPISLQSWEFLHSEVQVGKVLGQGAFGEVRAGKLKLPSGQTTDVAIKLTKGAAMLNKQKIKEMMNEARFMRNFSNKNVVKMYGVAVHEQPLYILLELVKGGSLQSYLQKNRGNVSISEKVKICLGSAQGLEYLHLNNCIHRDIAARNLLYATDEKIAKISDFGLSRAGPNYKPKATCKLPIKWLAPETITTLCFNYQTDVFSFGVLLFEIFADGAEPWEGVSNSEVKVNVCAGKFQQMPATCPEPMANLVRTNIFVKEPQNRFTMTEIVKQTMNINSSIENPNNENETQMTTPPRATTTTATVGVTSVTMPATSTVTPPSLNDRGSVMAQPQPLGIPPQRRLKLSINNLVGRKRRTTNR